jgi:hypothetical protein
MSFFPAGFDPRQDVVGALQLANVNTVDGDFGFIVGSDGMFTDINGKTWMGSRLISQPDMPIGINGLSVGGSLEMAFFDESGSLIEEVKALGANYVDGRLLTFYVQPLFSHSDLYAPQLAPIMRGQFVMRSITMNVEGAMMYRMSLNFENVNEGRNGAPMYQHTESDHSALIGAANPSLRFAPSGDRLPEPLF